MHGFKRLTFAALLLWGCGMLVSAVIPWEIIAEGRSALATVSRIGEMAKTEGGAPRILLIGSSPVVLGLSAKEIADATGVPTFNLAVPGVLPFFPEYLDTAAAFVRPDDIVVISDPNWLARGNATLTKGCVGSFSLSCAVWGPRPLPHLIEFARVLFGTWPTKNTAIVRNAIGDAVAVRSFNAAETIPTLPFAGRFADQVAVELRKTVENFRARGACPLITLGPIFVDADEQEQWRREQNATEARVAKLGLALSVITDGAVNTDRSLFLDSYEHPTAAERAIWTERVISRLVSRSQSPCSRSLARAEHSADRS